MWYSDFRRRVSIHKRARRLMMRNNFFKFFMDGFVGSFIIAAVIILAIPRAINEFVNHRSENHQNHSN